MDTRFRRRASFHRFEHLPFLSRRPPLDMRVRVSSFRTMRMRFRVFFLSSRFAFDFVSAFSWGMVASRVLRLYRSFLVELCESFWAGISPRWRWVFLLLLF